MKRKKCVFFSSVLTSCRSCLRTFVTEREKKKYIYLSNKGGEEKKITNLWIEDIIEKKNPKERQEIEVEKRSESTVM